MGAGDESTPAKAPPSSAQEAPTVPMNPDWSSSMQAYYGVAGATPPHFFPSAVTSPSPHPYIWGTQHPFLPPYGTPVPYPAAIYPPGGVYTHPNMAAAPVASPPVTLELDGKGGDGKDGNSVKKPKGIAGNSSSAGGKTTDCARETSGSGNDGASQSGDSDSEGSSDANEENNQQYHFASKKGSSNERPADGKPAAAAAATDPGTSLNIGMDLWNASSASGAAKMRPNLAPASSGLIPGGMIPDQWMQDEREIKRQRRKQSNRESARRSRLRKQAECEELQARVETLSNENSSLRDELKRLSEECEKLSSENSAIKGELMVVAGGSDGMGSHEENPSEQKH